MKERRDKIIAFIIGDFLANILNGTAFDGTIYGDSGNDTLIGGTGNDYMIGWTGQIPFVLAESGVFNRDDY